MNLSSRMLLGVAFFVLIAEVHCFSEEKMPVERKFKPLEVNRNAEGLDRRYNEEEDDVVDFDGLKTEELPLEIMNAKFLHDLKNRVNEERIKDLNKDVPSDRNLENVNKETENEKRMNTANKVVKSSSEGQKRTYMLENEEDLSGVDEELQELLGEMRIALATNEKF